MLSTWLFLLLHCLFNKNKPTHILFLSAKCGGIGLNAKSPADLTHLNLKMIVNLFDAIRQFKIEYLYGAGSICSYPTFCETPFSETNLWNGQSEFTNRGYGESKKILITRFYFPTSINQ